MPLRTRKVQPMRSFKGGLLVFHGKYGETYYHVPTEAHVHAAALQLLKANKEGGWYEHLKYDEKEEKEWGPKHPGMEPEDIEKLPEGQIRDAARKAWKEWSGYQATLKESNVEWDAIEAVLESQDGNEAWQILQERSDGEYERISIERLDGEDVKLLPRPEKPRHGQRWTDPEGQRWIFDGKKGKGLGWIKGAHAQWRALYAAHESGELEPEITQYDRHWVVYEAWSRIRTASREGQTAGEVEGFPTSPKDFKEAVEDLVEFADHPDQTMKLVTDPDKALETGEAVFQGRRPREKFTCTLKADASIEPHVEYEERKKRRTEAKKKSSKKKGNSKKKSSKKKVKSRKKTG